MVFGSIIHVNVRMLQISLLGTLSSLISHSQKVYDIFYVVTMQIMVRNYAGLHSVTNNLS